MGALALAAWFSLGCHAAAKDEGIPVDAFEQNLELWSGWAANAEGELPTIELIRDGDSQRDMAGLIKFPYIPGTQAMRKSVKIPLSDVHAVAFWAKSNQVGKKVQISIRTKDLVIYAAKAPLIDDEWRQFVIPLSDFQPSDTSENAGPIQPEAIAQLVFSVWNPEDVVSGGREPLELYLDDIEFLVNQ